MMAILLSSCTAPTDPPEVPETYATQPQMSDTCQCPEEDTDTTTGHSSRPKVIIIPTPSRTPNAPDPKPDIVDVMNQLMLGTPRYFVRTYYDSNRVHSDTVLIDTVTPH